MFSIITIQELKVLAPICKQEFTDDKGNFHPEKSNEETLEMLELIDDLLLIMKSKNLLLKKPRLKAQLSARIAVACKQKPQIGIHNKNI